MPYLDDLAAGAPPIGDDEEEAGPAPSPIGVPKDYVVSRTTNKPGWQTGNAPSRRNASTTALQAPRYFAGDEWKPAGRSPAERAAMQRELVDAGLLDPEDGFILGQWDAKTRTAYANLLAFANASGLDQTRALGQYQALNAANPKEGEKGPKGPIQEPLVKRLSNPEDIKALVKEVAVRTLGRPLQDDEITPFINAYQSMESTAQEQAYKAGGSGLPGGPGGTVVNKPEGAGFENMVEDKLRETKPEEASANAYLSRYDEFLGLLAKSGSLAGSTGSNG